MTNSLRPIYIKAVCVTQVILIRGEGRDEDASKGKAQVRRDPVNDASMKATSGKWEGLG